MVYALTLLTILYADPYAGRVDTAQHYAILLQSADETLDAIRAEMAAFDTCDTLFPVSPFDPEGPQCSGDSQGVLGPREASPHPRRQRMFRMLEETRQDCRF